MQTKFDVNQRVLIKAEIDEIRITDMGEVIYRVWISGEDTDDDQNGLFIRVFEHALKGDTDETTNSEE